LLTNRETDKQTNKRQALHDVRGGRNNSENAPRWCTLTVKTLGSTINQSITKLLEWPK